MYKNSHLLPSIISNIFPIAIAVAFAVNLDNLAGPLQRRAPLGHGACHAQTATSVAATLCANLRSKRGSIARAQEGINSKGIIIDI